MASEFIKIRRKMILFLVVLGPLGVIGLQAANFGLRYDWLTKVYKDNLWVGLIDNATMLAIPTLLIGLTILTSMIATIEHQTNAWKLTVALPVSKRTIYFSKVILSFLLLTLSCLLLFVGTIVLGITLKLGMDIPFLYLLKKSYFPFLAAMPLLSIQIWLSITIKNQAIPLTIGILGTILTLYGGSFPDWFPWKWPMLSNQWNEPLYFVVFGLITGIILTLLSMMDFNRKDVK